MSVPKLMNLMLALVITSGCSRSLEPEQSCNFVQNSQDQRVSWKGDLPVELQIHKSVPLEYRSAIYEAVAIWETRWGSRLFEIKGIDYSDSPNNQNGKNVIYWTEKWSESRKQEQARTTIFWKNDRITEADMKINAKNYDFFSDDVEGGTVHLESLMVHELGHVLGLKHIDKHESVMNSILPNYLIRNFIEDEDVDSLKCEYR